VKVEAHIIGGAEAYEGKSLRVTYLAGIYGGGSGQLWQIALERYEELYLSFWVKFADDFDFVIGGKLPGLAGGEGNAGGNKPDGTDGWSARVTWKYGMLEQYVYHPDQPTDYGESMMWDLGGQRYGDPGTWHHYETRVKINTPGQHDGIVQSWYDGELVLDRQDIRFRDVSTFAVDMLRFDTYFGGASSDYAPSKDEYAYFDNVTISTRRIGPNLSKEREDINGDGRVDVLDIQACVNVILSVQYDEDADVNGDGDVNALDVQEIVNVLSQD
jgi:hypothetical protein